jgi:hypothetical protein
MDDVRYVQPIAMHASNDGFLIVRDETRHWFLWFGDDARGLEEIPSSLATWMRLRPEMDDMPAPHLWFDLSSLPLASVPEPRLPS